jgi:hypothetical protein
MTMSLASYYLSAAITASLLTTVSTAQSPVPAAPSVAASVPDSQEAQRDPSEDEATTRSVSQIRIVRLSQVHGDVLLDRTQKFEQAFANLPIIAGERLRTRQGVAEVEFEDNSSLRLITDSQVDFPQLGRNGAGVTTTAVHLIRGSIYVSLSDNKSPGDFKVLVGQQTLTMTPSSHLRVDVDGKSAKVTVFQGSATAITDSGSLTVGKHKAATFDLGAGAVPTLARMDQSSPFDAWDKNAVDYHKTLAVAATYANSPFSYGVNDLAYYGSFSDVGGCGSMWRPYLTNASFDPFASGIWTWYPTSGYSWVSPYPWGWTPYHTGSWNYCGGRWGWQPEGGWNGLRNQPSASKIKIPGTVRPHPPTRPIGGQPTFVGVNLKTLKISKPVEESFVFESGSAGLGVPRGVFNHLDKISQHAVVHGTATTMISETQAARGLVQNAASSMNTASINAARGSQGNNQVSGSSFARNQSSSNSFAGHSASVSSSASSSSVSSASFSSSASAVSSSAASSGGGSHPH